MQTKLGAILAAGQVPESLSELEWLLESDAAECQGDIVAAVASAAVSTVAGLAVMSVTGASLSATVPIVALLTAGYFWDLSHRAKEKIETELEWIEKNEDAAINLLAAAINIPGACYRASELYDRAVVQGYKLSGDECAARLTKLGGVAPIDDVAPAKTAQLKSAQQIDLNAYAKSLHSGLPQAQKTEIKALQQAHGSNAAIERMIELYGLTDAQIEAEAPGLLAKLRPDTVQQLPALKSAEPVPEVGAALSVMDRLMEEPFQSMAVLGGQRSGKTYLMGVMTALIKAKIGTKVIYVNLYDPNGDAHTDWDHADICITGHLMKMDEYNGRKLIEKTTQVMQQFLHDSNAIVVFDEWVRFAHISNGWSKKVSQEIQQAKIMSTPGDYIEPEGIGHSAIALLNMVCAVAGDLATIGKKQLKAIHLLSPDFVAGNVEQQGKAMKALRPLIVGISLGRAVNWTHPKHPISQNITFDAAGYDNSVPNFAIPPLNQIPVIDSDRMAFINGEWFSLDNLPAKPAIAKSTAPAPEPLANPWDDTEPADAPTSPPSVNDTIADLKAAGYTIEDLKALFSATN